MPGTVLDASDRPVKDAKVRLKATAQQTQSDEAGGFKLTGQGARVTAWKPGHFITGMVIGDGPLTLRLRPLPKDDNPDYAWVDPTPDPQHAQRCGNCHAEMHREWSTSAHGQSATNRRFRNLYDGSDWHGRPDRGWNLLKEHPNGSAVCTPCHAPTVPAAHAAYEDLRQLDGVHVQGIHCDFCHKIAEASTANIGLEHGRFGYELLRPTTGQLFFGPLDDVDRDEDAYSPLYQQSRYCAACHEGTVFGVPVYTTYSEWLESPARKAGKQCQTCHMTPTGKLTNIAPGHGGVERDPMKLASHAMPGGTKEMLRRAVDLKFQLRTEKETLLVTTRLEATDVGHHVPTGFIDRHLILSIEGLDEASKPVQATDGPQLPAKAGFGKTAAGVLLGKQLRDFEGAEPVPFWRPARIVADTRLVPGKPREDQWQYASPMTSSVRVRLLYRRFYSEVATQKAWPDDAGMIAEQTLKRPAPGAATAWTGP